MTLIILKLEVVIFLKFIINSRAPLHKFVEKHQFDVLLSFKKKRQLVVQYTYLQRLLKYVDFSSNKIINLNHLAL